MPTIQQTIIIMLDRNNGTIEGTEHLAADLIGCNNHAHVRSKLKALEETGLIQVIRTLGGRGHKNIIRRNRNSPGYPRTRRS